MYLNRTICDVFSEMRSVHKTRNYSSLLSLVEEAQMMANRMEEGLYNKRDINETREKLKSLYEELDTVRLELKNAKKGKS